MKGRLGIGDEQSGGFLSVVDMIKSFAMDAAVNHAGIEADVLHDIDFAVVRPTGASGFVLAIEHPDGRPGPPSMRQPSSGHNAAIEKVTLALAVDTAGGIGFALLESRDFEPAPFHPGVSVRVVLQLLIAPAVITGPDTKSVFILKSIKNFYIYIKNYFGFILIYANNTFINNN